MVDNETLAATEKPKASLWRALAIGLFAALLVGGGGRLIRNALEETPEYPRTSETTCHDSDGVMAIIYNTKEEFETIQERRLEEACKAWAEANSVSTRTTMPPTTPNAKATVMTCGISTYGFIEMKPDCATGLMRARRLIPASYATPHTKSVDIAVATICGAMQGSGAITFDPQVLEIALSLQSVCTGLASNILLN